MIKKIFIFLGGLFAFALAFLAMSGGKSHIKKADKAEAKAKELKKKAELIEYEIDELEKQKGEINRTTKAKIERIKKLDDLQEISDAFNKL